MKKDINMILLFSHNLTKDQMNDAKSRFGVTKFINLPQNLQNIWSNIPTESENLSEISYKFEEFIKQNSSKNDIVLIQGDFGITYHMVNFCKSFNLKAVYSVTKRDVKESEVNSKIIKTSIFKHLKFREY